MESGCQADETEQIEAEQYVLEKPMFRPPATLFTAVKAGFVFITSVFGCSVLLYLLLRYGVPKLIAEFQRQVDERAVFVFAGIFVFCIIAGFLMVLKPMIIGFVHLYQHYASEELRRQCLFKPTCSEYMLLAIEKYGLLKGIKKSIGRFKKCNGTTYHVDYP
jgi:putative component of membrane protein insertase Oxa1/YidC/SpoIIIJ protein YidD